MVVEDFPFHNATTQCIEPAPYCTHGCPHIFDQTLVGGGVFQEFTVTPVFCDRCFRPLQPFSRGQLVALAGWGLILRNLVLERRYQVPFPDEVLLRARTEGNDFIQYGIIIFKVGSGINAVNWNIESAFLDNSPDFRLEVFNQPLDRRYINRHYSCLLKHVYDKATGRICFAAPCRRVDPFEERNAGLQPLSERSLKGIRRKSRPLLSFHPCSPKTGL